MTRGSIAWGFLLFVLSVGPVRSATAILLCDFDEAVGGGAASPPSCTGGDCPPETVCMVVFDGASGGGASASGVCACVPVPTSTPTSTPTATATDTATPTPTPTIPKMTGEPCTDPAECESENCVDQFCCNTPCDRTGESCDMPGSEGTCVAVAGAPAASPIGAAVLVISLLLLGFAALAGIPWRRSRRNRHTVASS